MRSLTWLDQVGGDERGATLALVAMSMTGFVAMAALVVDVGSGWMTRQSLIPATDAAALAAAQDFVHEPWDVEGACASARTYVARNAPEATMTGCEVATATTGGGRVTVTASESYDTNLAVPSEGAAPVESVSSAAWGSPLTVSALRPLAFCYDGSAELRDLIDNPPSYPTWVRVEFARDDPAACGGDPSVGNFATIDFEHSSDVGAIQQWMDDGYPGQVAFDDASVADCTTTGAVCHERPYASSDLYWQMKELRNSERYVTFPIYNYVDASQIHLIGAIRARIYDFDIYGGPTNWFYELKVEPGLVTGTCCGPSGVLAGNQVIAICGVDPDAHLGCESSPGS